jgi:hypothetical protein
MTNVWYHLLMSVEQAELTDGLKKSTGRSDSAAAAIMMHQYSYGVSKMTVEGTPCAASFQQCTEVLGTENGQYAGSASRSEWVSQMENIENRHIGPVRAWLSAVVGKPQHPVLQRSIDWIQQYGDSTNAAVQILLSELLMAVGQKEEAMKVYGDALSMHRQLHPEVGLIE